MKRVSETREGKPPSTENPTEETVIEHHNSHLASHQHPSKICSSNLQPPTPHLHRITTTIMARKHKEPRIVEDVQSSSDEEIDEDEAFNSEDELRYGEFFVHSKKSTKAKDSASDDESDEGSSSEDQESDRSKDWADDSDEEDDGGQYMLDLLNNLDKQSNNEEKKKESNNAKIRMDVPAAAVHLPESEFGAATVSLQKNNKLTLDSLMGGISDTQGFTQVQRTMRALSSGTDAKKLETTPAPLPQVVTERASRKVHYEATTEDVSRWTDVIHTQRDAETLDFRVNKGGARASSATKESLISKFEARTEFEEELARALEVAGMEDEKAMMERERARLVDGEDEEGEDDLGTNRISMEGESFSCCAYQHTTYHLLFNSLHYMSKNTKSATANWPKCEHSCSMKSRSVIGSIRSSQRSIERSKKERGKERKMQKRRVPG